MAETAMNSAKYTSPAIVPDVVGEFRKSKHVIPLPSTVAMNQKVPAGAVMPALVHHLFERVKDIEAQQLRMARLLDSLLSVRDLQQFRRVA